MLTPWRQAQSVSDEGFELHEASDLSGITEVIQAEISDCNQATEFGPSFTCFGNVPSLIRL